MERGRVVRFRSSRAHTRGASARKSPTGAGTRERRDAFPWTAATRRRGPYPSAAFCASVADAPSLGGHRFWCSGGVTPRCSITCCFGSGAWAAPAPTGGPGISRDRPHGGRSSGSWRTGWVRSRRGLEESRKGLYSTGQTPRRGEGFGTFPASRPETGGTGKTGPASPSTRSSWPLRKSGGSCTAWRRADPPGQ